MEDTSKVKKRTLTQRVQTPNVAHWLIQHAILGQGNGVWKRELILSCIATAFIQMDGNGIVDPKVQRVGGGGRRSRPPFTHKMWSKVFWAPSKKAVI